jgi:hypothetical protein
MFNFHSLSLPLSSIRGTATMNRALSCCLRPYHGLAGAESEKKNTDAGNDVNKLKKEKSALEAETAEIDNRLNQSNV